MKIKKYYVPNMKEGRERIKEELGPEAIIIQSRKVRRKGLQGFFSPRQIEVTVAVDTHSEKRKLQEQLDELGSYHKIRGELAGLRLAMERLLSRGELPDKIKEKENDRLAYWKTELKNQGIFDELIQEFIGDICNGLLGEVQLTEELMRLILHSKIRKRLLTAPEKGAPLQVFVGPTGVGKTTTLAKLAARYALYQGEKVGIITIDHYRIGAVEQLRTYSEITGLPLEVAMSPRELRRAIEKFSGCQRILIDTAGRSALNLTHIQELAGYLRGLPPAEIFLVVSATTKPQDLKLIAGNFKCMGCNRLIYTKLDETSTYGVLLNGSYLTDLPAIYLTTGQSVPDDICLADVDRMTSLIIGEED